MRRSQYNLEWDICFQIVNHLYYEEIKFWDNFCRSWSYSYTEIRFNIEIPLLDVYKLYVMWSDLRSLHVRKILRAISRSFFVSLKMFVNMSTNRSTASRQIPMALWVNKVLKLTSLIKLLNMKRKFDKKCSHHYILTLGDILLAPRWFFMA